MNCKNKFAFGLVLFIVIGSGMSAPSTSSPGYKNGLNLQQRTKRSTDLMSFLSNVLQKHSGDMDKKWPPYFDWTSTYVQAPKYDDYGSNFIDSHGRDLSYDFDSFEYNSMEDNVPYVEVPYKYDYGPSSHNWSPYARTVPELPHKIYKNLQEHDYGHPPETVTVDIGWQNMQPSASAFEIEEMIWERRFSTPTPPPLTRELAKKKPDLKKANDRPPNKNVKFSVQRCFTVHSGEREGSYADANDDEEYLVFLVKKDQPLTDRKPTVAASYPTNAKPVVPTTGRPVQEQTTQGLTLSSSPPPALETTEKTISTTQTFSDSSASYPTTPEPVVPTTSRPMHEQTTQGPIFSSTALETTEKPIPTTQASAESSTKEHTGIPDNLTPAATTKTTEEVVPTTTEPIENNNLDTAPRTEPSALGDAGPESSSPIDNKTNADFDSSTTPIEEEPETDDKETPKTDDRAEEPTTSATFSNENPETDGIPREKMILNDDGSEKEETVEEPQSADTDDVQSQNLISTTENIIILTSPPLVAPTSVTPTPENDKNVVYSTLYFSGVALPNANDSSVVPSDDPVLQEEKPSSG